MSNIKRLCIYGLVFTVWATLTTVIIDLEYRLELQKVEAAFNQRVVRLYENLERISRDNEAILEGFSAFLGAIDYVDRDSAARYARQISARYPHIHQLGVVLVVNRGDLKDFIRRQKKTWFPKFTVNALNFNTGETAQLNKDKPTFLPIIFIEPLSPAAELKIGADIDSEPFLLEALNQSLKVQSAFASLPFNLAGGPREYMLFHPVPDSPKSAEIDRKKALALLEVDSDAVRDEIEPLTDHLDILLYHAAYPRDDPQALLFRIAPPSPSLLESKLFPNLSAEKKLTSTGQPFAFIANKQVRWTDIDVLLLLATASASALAFVLFLLFLSNHYRREQQRKDSEKRLHYMATHDALTGLPNRTLLADRFNQACSRAQRHGTCFSVMFIDLNKFKSVNDTYGHEIGDQLLKALGELLLQCIRGEDTLSRISGDEFVMLLESASREKAEQVALKMRDKLATPLDLGDIKLNVSLSQGIAEYPTDGTTLVDLLKAADERMYRAKEQSKISPDQERGPLPRLGVMERPLP